MMIKKMVAPQPQSTIPPTPYSEQFATFFQEKWVGDAEADTGDTGRIAATKSKSVGYEMPSDHTTVVRLRTFSSPRPAPPRRGVLAWCTVFPSPLGSTLQRRQPQRSGRCEQEDPWLEADQPSPQGTRP